MFFNFIPKWHLHFHCHLNILTDVNNCRSVGLFNVLISERAFILKVIYRYKAAAVIHCELFNCFHSSSIDWVEEIGHCMGKHEGFMIRGPSEDGQVVTF